MKGIENYLRDFKSICDNLANIKKPIKDLDKVLQFANGLGPNYKNFLIAMFTKPPNLLFSLKIFKY